MKQKQFQFIKYSIVIITVIIIYACEKENYNKKDFINTIEKTYSEINNFKTIEINYDRINYNAYQSYNYKEPDSLILNNRIQINDTKNYFSSRIASFPGDFKFSQQEFQNDTINFAYDSLGIVFGRAILKQDLNRYQQVKQEVNQLLDYRVIQEMIDNKDSISILEKLASKNLIIAKIYKSDDTISYTFDSKSLQLISLEKSESNEKWKFNLFKKSFSRNIKYYRNKELKFEYRINDVKELKEIPKNNLKLPINIDAGNIIDYPEMEISFISKNLYLVKNVARDRNVLFKINNKDIMVFGAPISDKISKQVVSLINNSFPNKKIISVYISHSHSDHIGGLSFYAEKEVNIFADEYTIEAIKEYPKFKNKINKFSFKSIKNSEVRDGVKYYIPKNTHSVGQSFVYFLENDVLYQGDFLEIAKDNTLPHHINETAKTFISFLKANNIKPKRIIGHHRNDNIDLKFINLIE